MQSALAWPLRITRLAALWRIGHLPSVQGRRMHQSTGRRETAGFFVRACRYGEGTWGQSRRCRPSVWRAANALAVRP